MDELIKKRLAQSHELLVAQGRKGNWDYDGYMHGMYNGMELIIAAMEERDPVFRKAPAEGFISEPFSMVSHLRRQIAWSEKTFGPGERTSGIIDHIHKELKEVKKNPTDVTEWIDIVLLALDGAWRVGNSPKDIVTALTAKQSVNESRKWPDWKKAKKGKAIEHVSATKKRTSQAVVYDR